MAGILVAREPEKNILSLFMPSKSIPRIGVSMRWSCGKHNVYRKCTFSHTHTKIRQIVFMMSCKPPVGIVVPGAYPGTGGGAVCFCLLWKSCSNHQVFVQLSFRVQNCWLVKTDQPLGWYEGARLTYFRSLKASTFFWEMWVFLWKVLWKVQLSFPRVLQGLGRVFTFSGRCMW